jgi:predicted metal-dependent hydrolase
MLTIDRNTHIKDIISKKQVTTRHINTWLTRHGIDIPFCDGVDINDLEDFVAENQEYLKKRLSSHGDIIILVDKGHFRIEGKK